MEFFGKVQQLFFLAGHQACHGNAGPLGHDAGDVVLGHLLAQERAFPLRGGKSLLGGCQVLLQLRELSVAQLRGARQIVGALGCLGFAPRLLDAFAQFLDLPDAGLFAAPAFLQALRFPLGGGKLGFELPQPLLGGGVLLLLERQALHLQLQDAPVQFVQRLGFGGDLHLEPGSGLVHQVNGLVGQEALGDVAVGKLGGGHQGGVRDAHSVMHLVALAQAAQDRDGVFHRGLPDVDLLEAPLQGGVLLHVLAVLVQGGGPDAAQLAARQHGFEEVARVHGAFHGSGSDHGVDLVDEEHDAAVGICHFLEHRLQPFLKLAAVLGTGDQRAHVQGYQAAVFQRIRHVAGHDAPGESFGDGGLAHARFAD